MSDDDEIYGAPTSNEIDFFKIKNRFEQQSQHEKKPEIRPKPTLRESYIQQRIKNINVHDQPKTLQGRNSIVSTFPPEDPSPLPPKTPGKLSNSPFHSQTTTSNDDLTPPPLTPKKGQGKKIDSPFLKNSEKVQAALSKKTSSIKADGNKKPKEIKTVTIVEENVEKKKSVVRKSVKAEKENVLPDGLKVGMIRKGTDGKSYKLLALPPKAGPPPPIPTMPDKVDLSPYFQDDDMYDDVDVSLIGKSASLKRGSMRPCSEILPMTEEEEEEMERKNQAKRRQKPDSEIYDDTMEAEDEEFYDDIANIQPPQDGDGDVYEEFS